MYSKSIFSNSAVQTSKSLKDHKFENPKCHFFPITSQKFERHYNIFKGTKIGLAYLGLRKSAPMQIQN